MKYCPAFIRIPIYLQPPFMKEQKFLFDAEMLPVLKNLMLLFDLPIEKALIL